MVIPGYECITEYDEAKHMAQMEKLAEENLRIGEERGEKRGEERGRLLMLVDLVKAGLLNVSDAAKSVNMTVPEFEAETAKLLSERESI